MNNLVVFEKQIDPREVISTLSELLERAQSGEFESFIAVCVRPNGEFFTRSSGYKNSLELVGALTFAQYDLVKASTK
jgi:hypothetical protein